MKQFDEGGAGALKIYWEQDWGWSADTPSGQTYSCQLVGYQTPFSAFKEGDYTKCVKHYFNVNVVGEERNFRRR
ncbi:chitinase [Enterobacter asburiae]|nr:chitinase [Enterobacter asburiae]